MMVDIPMPTAESLEQDLSRYEEQFRARYTNEDPEFKHTVSLDRVRNHTVPKITPWPPRHSKSSRKRNYPDDYDSGGSRYHPREKRGRLSPYGRSQRKRDEYSLNPVDDFSRTRRSPRELWDPPKYDVPASDVPLPKTPSASPSAEEPTDLYPPAPAPAEAMYDVPPPCEAVKSERQTVMEDVSGVANFPSMSSSGGDTRIKAEMFDVMAPAFTPIERAVSGAPSQDDVQAILSQAHSSSSATVSVQKAADLRKKKWKEEKTRVKREVKEQRLAGAKDHVSSRPSTTSRLKNIPTSSILNESLESAKKSASAGLIVTSGRYERSRPVSSGDDSEEVDVDTVTDDTLSTLPVSISLSNLPASRPELTSKSSLDSGFHTGSSGPSSLPSSVSSEMALNPSAKKRKKKKKDKKKDQEDPVNMASHVQADVGGRIKLKINLTKQESSFYQ